MNDNNYLIIRSLSMANWLCNNGYKILKVDDSKKNEKFKVFLFDDNQEIRKTMKLFPGNKEV